jgi:DNA-binding Lrp family transcriptional regulator
MEKKEVKNSDKKQDLNLTIFNLLKQGKKPIQISKQLNITMPNLSYYLSKLSKDGYIKKIGYGTWEVKINTLRMQTNKKQIRGHAFIWIIKLNKKFDWIKLLNNSKYNLVRNSIPRLMIKDRKVWLGRKTITIYENRSFYGENSIQSRKYAVIGLFEVLEALEKELSINLRPYVFKPVKEHYSMIKNELARQYNRNNEKMIISDDIEGEWLWIDDSESLNELETKNIVRSKQVQNWWNDFKKDGFKVNSSYVNNGFKELTNAQIQTNIQIQQFSQQIKSHLSLIQEYRKENIAWRKSESKKIKDNLNNGTQTNLSDFK